jgi:hypothetical protein
MSSPRIFAELGYRERAALTYPEPEEHFRWTAADLNRIESDLRRSLLFPRADR